MHMEILLSTALRQANKHHYNLSITQSLCKTHIFQKETNINNLLSIWQQKLSIYNHRDHHIIDWLNIVLFNICALNQQYMAECDNRLLESTQEAASLYDRVNKKQLIQSSQTELVKTKLTKWLSLMLQSYFFTKIFSQMTNSSISKDKSTRYLIQTIDYLIHKYKFTCKYESKIQEIMESIPKSTINQNNTKIITEVNKKIFSSGQKFASFMQMVESNYSIDIQDLAELICINYIQLYPPRSIFNSADQTGKSFSEQLIDFLIRKTTKVDLFSEKIQSYRPYQLLMAIIFQKLSTSISQWNLFLFENFNQLQKSAYSLGNQKVYQMFGRFLTVFIPNDYPSLNELLKYVYSSLLAKYSAIDSFQLMKKLLLNRLFLNPLYFSELIDPNQEEMSRYVRFANSLRILFYQKKVLALQNESKNPRIIEISQLLINSLRSLLNSKQKSSSRINNKDKSIYVNDKLLIKLFNRVSDGITGFSHQSSNKSNRSKQSNQSESELSFSLKNQSMSRLGISSNNPQFIGISNNSSFPILPKPQQKIKSSPNKGEKIKNQNSSSTSQNNIYNDLSNTVEIEGLQSLIGLRRQYGELYRQIEARCHQKKQQKSNKMMSLWRLNEGIIQLREELVRSMNQVLINSLLF